METHIMRWFQALLLLFPNGPRLKSSCRGRSPCFRVPPHTAHLLLFILPVHLAPGKSTALLCENSSRMPTTRTTWSVMRFPRSLSCFMSDSPGVGHGDDLGFLFPMSPPGFPKMVTTEAQRKTRTNLLKLLESFTQNGIPTLDGVEVWCRVEGEKEEYLEIGESLKMINYPASFAHQLNFWKQVF